MERIINKTPHPVVILDEENKVVASLPTKGLIRLESTMVNVGECNGTRITRTEFGAPEGLPQEEAGTRYVVSQIVKSALPQRADLLVPAEVVRDEAGNIVGCRSLGV